MTITIQKHGIYERRVGKIICVERCDEHGSWPGKWYQANDERTLVFNDDGSRVVRDYENDLIREIVAGPGWLPHNGGENPAHDKQVEVAWRNGNTRGIFWTQELDWAHTGNRSDILAYRIIEEAETAKEDNTKEPTMTPLHMMILIECYVTKSPGININPDLWGSIAATECRTELYELSLISGTLNPIITDKGRVWLERALATPMPVQKWVFEGDEE